MQNRDTYRAGGAAQAVYFISYLTPDTIDKEQIDTPQSVRLYLH